MRWILAACLGLVAAVPLACGDGTLGESQHVQKSAGADGDTLPLLALSSQAPWTTRYAGARRVETRIPDGDHATMLIYREEILADGEGRFAVESTDVLSFVPDPAFFQLAQAVRVGYHYRYRDFAVRDLDAFLASWAVTDLDQVVEVAGRACQLLRVDPAAGQGSSFDVALDLETGLVLRSVEVDGFGQVLARMEFETYDANPELEGAAWFSPPFPETELDPGAPLGPQASFEVLEPAVLPDGYAPWKAAVVVTPGRGRWVKQVFTDGVRPLFFFHAAGSGTSGAARGLLAPDPTTAAVPAPTSGSPERIMVYPLGAVDVAQGVLRGREVLAFGRVGAEPLLDLLESAID